MEFLELNKLLGARRFTLYNHTVSKEVSCVLADYAERGEVELLPWRLNVASQTEIRYIKILKGNYVCLSPGVHCICCYYFRL